jgi:two-component system KDP operon response regulator KdpE
MEPNNINILVVEDDRPIQNFIHYTLSAEGFRYISSGTGQSALSILVSEPVDLMLLDLGLPDCDGKEIIRTVREWSEIPIIVVSGRNQDKDKAAMLDLGADDYLTKPFSATELMARIRVALRHRQKNGNEAQNILQVGGLRIDPDKRLIYVDGREIHMTPMEYSLMTLFFKNIGKVLTTKHILNEIWGVGYGNDTQALRALMAGLRRKIERNPANPRYILTEMGIGYRLTDE